jgi:hypothetical protein
LDTRYEKSSLRDPAGPRAEHRLQCCPSYFNLSIVKIAYSLEIDITRFWNNTSIQKPIFLSVKKPDKPDKTPRQELRVRGLRLTLAS